MNWNMIEGNWRQYRFELLWHWQGLTEEKLVGIAGKRARFSRLLQDVYHISAEEAERQIAEFQGVVTATPSRGVKENASGEEADHAKHGSSTTFLQGKLGREESKSG